MKIALITPFLPYAQAPHAGGLYTYQLLKYLSSYHSVTLIVRVNVDEKMHVQAVSTLCTKVYATYASCHGKYSWVRLLKTILSYFSFFRMRDRILRKYPYDLIQFEYSESAFFLPQLKSSKMILNLHDVVTQRILREQKFARNILYKFIHSLQFMLYRPLEGFAIKKMDGSLVRLTMDENFVNTHFNSGMVRVIPLMVDEITDSSKVDPQPATLLFTGAFNRRYNELAAIFLIEKIFSVLQVDIPHLKLILAGNSPGKKLEKLMFQYRNIELTGFVEDLNQYYLKATMFVSPIFTGGGMIYKNIEAMSFGIPVITTPFANESIAGVNENDLLLANDASDFVSAIKTLLSDGTTRRKIGKNGQQFVKTHFSSEIVLKEYASAIELFGAKNSENADE